MQKILIFTLPEEQEAAYAAEHGAVWLDALRDLDEWLRRREKDGAAWATEVREKLREAIAPLALYEAPS